MFCFGKFSSSPPRHIVSDDPCRNGHGCPKRKQGMCLHEDPQEYSADELEEIPCLRGAVQQLRKLLNDLE